MTEIRPPFSLSLVQKRRLQQLLALPHVSDILELLNKDGAITKIVGGAVRNALLGCAVQDVDFATTLLPQEIMDLAIQARVKAIPTGFDHGTVTLVFEGASFEVTTLREDVITDGRHAIVRFGLNFQQDAQRRDFTMNALYVDRQGHLDDFVGGIEDLLTHRVRFIGDPVKRIREDGLRIIRFFRFSAWYGSGICDAEGLNATLRARSSFFSVSRERVRSDFFRLLDAPYAEPIINIMADCGWLTPILGGIGYVTRFSRVCSHDPDLFRNRLWRLAALSVMGSMDVNRLKHSLCLTRFEYGELYTVSQWLVRIRSAYKSVAAPMLCAWLLELNRLDILGVALALENPDITEEACVLLSGWREGTIPLPELPFSGNDLLELGIPPGGHLGTLLMKLKLMWAHEWYKSWAHKSLDTLKDKKLCVLKHVLKNYSY